MERPRIYWGWVLVWALGGTTIVSYGTTLYLYGVLVVPMQRELGWSRALLSGAFSLSQLMTGLLGLPVGRLLDRHGARVPMTIGSVLGAAGLAAAALVRQPWQLYAVWSGVLALAMALTLYPVTFTVIANWFVGRRGSALALLTLLGGLASPIFVPLAGVLVERSGWRATLVAFGLLQLVVAAPVHALLVRRRPEDLGLLPDGEELATPRSPAAGAHLREAVAGLPFWTLTAAFALGWLAHSVILVHQIPYLIGRGFGPALAASLAGLVGVASLPGRYLLNRVSERLSPGSLLAACYVAQAAGVGLLGAAASPLLVWLYVAVYGGAFGAISPLRASTMADQFGRRAYGAITAASGVPVAVAGAIGPTAAGAIYDRVGSYGPALALTAGAFLLSALAVALTPGAAGRHNRSPYS
ncbi:MAG TPA: MFS transporter [Candidatus Dormibacteraeota bacterium]|nr:MFS transporter [Candidatus Dormibacteraeota bacterium]